MRFFLIFLVVGALAIAGAFVLGAVSVAPVGGGGPARMILIPPGTSVTEIARRLGEAGLIRSPAAFVVAARVRGVAPHLQHGEYALSPAMSTLEILDRLARGEVVLYSITVPEGYVVTQIARLLGTAGLGDPDEFLRLAREQGGTFSFEFTAGLTSLEGYLFPDTYRLPRGLTARQIIERMLRRFDDVVTADLREKVRARGLTLHQAITVASLIEREAAVPGERAIIAGVIYNRLRRGMRLEIDATVLYALGRHKTKLTAGDLRVDSPYNTYRHAGLPPGPIANPGLASIIAALNPEPTPYLFYVLRPDGSHAFSRTLEEHLAAIRRYRP